MEQEDELSYSDNQTSDDSIQPDEIPREERHLRTQAYDKSISDVVAMIAASDIILDPDYQRNYIWDNKKASLLIESILLNVPIPVIYVAEDEDSRWSVVDGLQRLNTLRRFFDGEFKLSGLEVLQELNGKYYSALNPKASRILRNGILRIILVFKESHPEIKYEIFMRLNRGAIKLTEQELRNCLYRGPFNNLLHELRKNTKFLEMIGLSKPHNRMADGELILRYFTISDSFPAETGELKNYTGKIKSSLNKYIGSKRNIGHDLRLELKHQFETTVDKVYEVFGKHAFQRVNEDGSYESRINRAIMDFIMISFERLPAEVLIPRGEEIRNLLRELPLKDPRFNESILIGTSDKRQLEYRLTTWTRELKELLTR
jgi:hypothetical protein